MKKIICLFALCLASIPLSAQSRMSYSLEFAAGVGLWKTPLFSLTPEFVAQYDMGGGFLLGAGTGLRYARPYYEYIVTDGVPSRNSCNELDVPVFMRIGYGTNNLYANIDAGYAIGLLSIAEFLWIPYTNYSGLFVEPQVGWRWGKRSALALGLLLQQSLLQEEINEGTKQSVRNLNLFTPSITLRYVLGL